MATIQLPITISRFLNLYNQDSSLISIVGSEHSESLQQYFAKLGDAVRIIAENHQTAINNINNTLGSVQEKCDSQFIVMNFNRKDLNMEIPVCTEDILNTAINKLDYEVPADMVEKYQVLGMFAYEFFDVEGKRINCWPVCQFTQRVNELTAGKLGIRLTAMGSVRPLIKSCNCWILLKHR